MRGLRLGLVALGVLLIVVLAGYIEYARRKAQALAFIQELPKRLGADITQETDNFTYSQSLKGKTIFTVRASKELQHSNGVITLREVGIQLYGPTGTRSDRIHGQEFEYDQKNGILRAVGEALIDLAPPGAAPSDDAHIIHVRTSGLVFRKEDGTATTDQGVDFSSNGIVGQAVGASYNSKTDVLILQSAVKLNSTRGPAGHERPVQLLATRAELDRATNVVLLEAPKYTSSSPGGEQAVSAAQAIVHTSADGKPTAVEARGHVQLAGEGRGTVFAERLDMQLNDDGQPREGHLYGGVRFVDDTPARQEQGQAQDARVAFGAGGQAQHALLTGKVQLNESTSASSRRLDADRVDLALSGGGKQKLVLRGAVATAADGARLKLAERSVKGSTVTDVRASTLTGRFNAAGLTGLDGAGRTFLEQVDTNPHGQQISKQTSTGETLAVDLKPTTKGRMELSHAVQHGEVEIVREAVARKAGAAAEIEHARGATGDYDADRDQLTLTGDAAVSDASSAVFADRIQLDRKTGDALAQGTVRVSYLQGKPGSEPTHVLAERALAHKASGTTEFTAAAGARVRMWQGASQVEAPVLDFDRNKKTVVAHGAGEVDAVRTTLAAAPARPGVKPDQPTRVLSQRMTYTDATRQVDYNGHVQVKEAAGTLRANDALVQLSPVAAKADTTLLGGKVERVTGTGTVELTQPGSRATGEKIVYTAADNLYVLTGTKAVPPRLDDDKNGSVTGTQLRFRRGEESVEVVGGEGSRVRSEPRARQ